MLWTTSADDIWYVHMWLRRQVSKWVYVILEMNVSWSINFAGTDN